MCALKHYDTCAKSEPCYRDGTFNDPEHDGEYWQQLPGNFKYISSGQSIAWAISSNGDLKMMTDSSVRFDANEEIQFEWEDVDMEAIWTRTGSREEWKKFENISLLSLKKVEKEYNGP